MIFKLDGRYRRTTNEQLLADLRQFAQKQGTNTFTSRQYHLLGNYYSSIFIRRFGSWNNALLMAGLQPKKHFRVSALHLLQNLHTLWTTLGRQPHAIDLCPPHSLYSRPPYLRVFGTWRKALEAFVQWSASDKRPGAEYDIPGVAAPTRQRTINWRLRHLIMKRDHFRCVACGAAPANEPGTVLHIDHIIPYSKGGTIDPHNLQTLCEVCNIGKGDLAA